MEVPKVLPSRSSDSRTQAEGVWGVFLVFLQLGLRSFGGPIAHLGYFRDEFVNRRRWLSEERYADLVALCQFLPGPASSQVGMALGLGRAGWSGAAAAWLGFTLPSAIALMLLAQGAGTSSGMATGLVHGLKVMAVAVVAQAVFGMAKSLCPDRLRAGVALAAAMLVLLLPSMLGQTLAIVLGGCVGWRCLSLPHSMSIEPWQHGVSRRAGALLLVLFVTLLFALPVLAASTDSAALTAISDFYRAGSLVFGGGHVVLPMLQASVVPAGWVGNDTFLAGYAAAQAVPGPLFAFAAFLGAAMPFPFGAWAGGIALLLAIFLPAFLLVAGALPYWESWSRHARIQRTMAGVNAAVVGVLGAALYDPVWISAIRSKMDFALALAAYGLLVVAKASPVLVVALAALVGAVCSS